MGEIIPAALAVRVRKTLAGPQQAPFVLDADFEVACGITILFGPSGAGKSTLLDCIAGLVTPEAGRISVGEESLLDVARNVDVPPRQRKVAYVFQNLALFPHMTAEQNVAYGLADLSAAERAQRVSGMLEAFRAESLRARKPGVLSGGERQRVALARSLATSPRVLLLDEPLTALDAGLKKSIMDDLRAWNAAQKIPILYVTHSRVEVDALGERVIALDQGKVIGAGTPLEVLESPRRSSLAQAVGFENLLSARVTELREADGVMRVQIDGSKCEIETPLGYREVGSSVKLAIRAGDILLAIEQPRGLSARNVIAGKIIALEQRGTTVVAQVTTVPGEDVVFTVHLTPGARRSLDLEMNRAVWLVIKTHSCHVLYE